MFTDEGAQLVRKLMQQNAAALRQVNQAGFVSFEVQHRCKDGRLLWGEVKSRSECDAQGSILGYHGITREITERKLLQDRVQELAFHDSLTRLPNRRLLLDRLSQAMAASKRSGLHCALMFIDLDRFKALNDGHGHEAGDLLLVEVAIRLQVCVREDDSVSRFGGDEFVVLLSNLDADRAESAARAAIVAEKLRLKLSEPCVLNIVHAGRAEASVHHQCTASIGVTVFVDHEATCDDVLKQADAAMYRAKATGGNAIGFHGTRNAI
jgi:diguanylate cyclase (GGDEF)-like protein